MDRLRPYPVSAFCALTLFIWSNRIWLAWTNSEDTVAEKLVWSTSITVFVVAGAVLLALVLSDRFATTAWAVPVTRVFAGWTVAYWAVRFPMIALADHDVPFKVVHGVLAAVSVTAAVAAWRALRPGERSARPQPRPA